MKRFIGAVTVVVACLVIAGGAFAFNYTDHVSVAPNGKGDLLVFPVYMAMGGTNPIQTDFTIVNTSKTHSVVAKVVVRSFAYSQELLDFLIYLSPTDMWVGTLAFGPKGPMMVSTDKSGPVLVPGKALAAVTCTGTTGDRGVDSNQFGYVEVIEAWSANLASPTRAVITNAYDASARFTPYGGADTIDMLSGSYQISVPTLGWVAADRAFTMQSYDNTQYLSSTMETRIGAKARNNIQEVEAGFNKDFLAMTFNNNPTAGSSIHLFTFPTKLSNAVNCTRVSGSAYFPVDGLVNYDKITYDNEENAMSEPFSPSLTNKMPDEVMSLAGPTYFDFGWVLYEFTKKGTAASTVSGLPLNYTGTPVIMTNLYFSSDFTAISGGTAYADGTVSSVPGGAALPTYQYSSQFVTTQ